MHCALSHGWRSQSGRPPQELPPNLLRRRSADLPAVRALPVRPPLNRQPCAKRPGNIGHDVLAEAAGAGSHLAPSSDVQGTVTSRRPKCPKGSQSEVRLNAVRSDTTAKKTEKNPVASRSEERFCWGKWRKRWDSNPRWGSPHAGFQDQSLKPLGHTSVLSGSNRNLTARIRGANRF